MSEQAEPTDLSPLLGDLVTKALKRLVDRSRTGLRQAADTGRRRLELRQLDRDLEHFWMRLGKTTYHLVEAGELDHPALRKAMERIDELEARIAAARRGELVDEPDGVAPPDDAS